MGISSTHTAVLAARGSSSSGQGKCSKTCEIIIASTVAGVFISVMLCIGMCYVYTSCKLRKRCKIPLVLPTALTTVKPSTPDRADVIAKLEQKLGKYLDENPHILDMPDRKIPDYLKAQDLTAQELEDVILVIARRRLARDGIV